jgi:hypothetical protein
MRNQQKEQKERVAVGLFDFGSCVVEQREIQSSDLKKRVYTSFKL